MAEIIRTPAFRNKVRQIWLPRRTLDIVTAGLGTAIEACGEDTVRADDLSSARNFTGIDLKMGEDGIVLRGRPQVLDAVSEICIAALKPHHWAGIAVRDMTLPEYEEYAAARAEYPGSIYCNVTPYSQSFADLVMPVDALVYDGELQQALPADEL